MKEFNFTKRITIGDHFGIYDWVIRTFKLEEYFTNRSIKFQIANYFSPRHHFTGTKDFGHYLTLNQILNIDYSLFSSFKGSGPGKVKTLKVYQKHLYYIRMIMELSKMDTFELNGDIGRIVLILRILESTNLVNIVSELRDPYPIPGSISRHYQLRIKKDNPKIIKLLYEDTFYYTRTLFKKEE